MKNFEDAEIFYYCLQCAHIFARSRGGHLPLLFFDKGNILISKDQLHPASTTTPTLMAVRMHTTKKREIKLRNKSPATAF
jgi:hypothetical protein